MALNREDAQDISAVVRLRRCLPRAGLAQPVAITPAQALVCCAVPGFASRLSSFYVSLSLGLPFAFFTAGDDDDEDEDGGEAGPRTPGHYELETYNGGQEAPSAAPYLSLRVANPLSSCLLRTRLGGHQHMCRQGAWGRVSTRAPLDCACTLQYLPGLPGFQVADQGLGT